MRDIKFEILFTIHNGDFTKSIGKTYTTLDMLIDGNVDTNYDDIDIIAKRQFTGLKDCNGVDIYKGDIMLRVMVDDSIHRCVIRYSDKYAKFVFCPIMEKWDFDMDVVDNPYERQSYEVIGTIHENPELMESDNV